MNFFYFNTNRYVDKDLYIRLNEAANRVVLKLKEVNLDTISISDYNKKYLGHHIINIQFSLQLFCNILYHALENKTSSIEKLIMVDYGGGTGLISLLAAELGVNKIIYNDIYDVSVNDAKVIAQTLGYTNIDYIKGDISDLVVYCQQKKIQPDSLVSSDVIEHIYNIPAFFENLRLLNGSNNLAFVFQTAANIKNPVKRKQLERYQRDDEFKERENTFGHKQSDSLKAFYMIRREFIKEKLPQLSEVVLHELSNRTRGMRLDDIESAILNYADSKIMPPLPMHKTNTCDPLTGNWTERLMEFQYLQKVIKANGFEIIFLKGFYGYNFNEAYTKKTIKKALNFLISITRRLGFIAAPYIMIKSK